MLAQKPDAGWRQPEVGLTTGPFMLRLAAEEEPAVVKERTKTVNKESVSQKSH